MPKGSGFTAVELLISLTILTILFALAIPSYSSLIAKQHLRTSVDIFTRSVQTARARAVYSNHRVCLVNKNNSWQAGWVVFEDLNNNCQLDAAERSIFDQRALHNSIRISATGRAVKYISYLPNGQSVQLTGAFQADSIYFCQNKKGQTGYRLVIAKGGRLRIEEATGDWAHCID